MSDVQAFRYDVKRALVVGGATGMGAAAAQTVKNPGPTDTPLARANADVWLTFAQDYRDATNTPHLTPEQMGNTMVFLDSDAASGLSGVNILVDTGHVMSSLTGSFEPGQQLIGALLGTS